MTNTTHTQCSCPVYSSHEIRYVEKSGRKKTECLHFLHLYIEKPGCSVDLLTNSGLEVIYSCRHDSWMNAVMGHLQERMSFVQVQAVLEHFLQMKRLLLTVATCFKILDVILNYYKGSSRTKSFYQSFEGSLEK